MALKSRQEVGSIESKKAESSLYAPLAGVVVELNESLLNDPTAINVDKYGAGWMFELQAEESQLSEMLSAVDYLSHLEQAWEVAQRTIKGQVNA
jgi:glycine cleavage system H protein